MLKTWSQCSLSCWISLRHPLCQLNALSLIITLLWNDPSCSPLFPILITWLHFSKIWISGICLVLSNSFTLCKPSRAHFRPSDELHILKNTHKPSIYFQSFLKAIIDIQEDKAGSYYWGWREISNVPTRLKDVWQNRNDTISRYVGNDELLKCTSFLL